MFSIFSKSDWRSISELEPLVQRARAKKNKLEIRATVKILVIDDQPFNAGQNLRNNGYNITHVSDVHSISQAVDYQIVLCDLQGVGTQVHANLQGAHLIKEIKGNYPQKIVFAFTGGATNSLMAKAAERYADKFLKKDADLDDWIEALDSSIDNIIDPVYMWKQFRKHLLDSGVTPFQLTQIEDFYVRSFGGAGGDRNEIVSLAERIGVQPDVRAVIQGFISSLIFKLIIG